MWLAELGGLAVSLAVAEGRSVSPAATGLGISGVGY